MEVGHSREVGHLEAAGMKPLGVRQQVTKQGEVRPLGRGCGRNTEWL